MNALSKEGLSIATSAAIAKGDLVINGVEMFDGDLGYDHSRASLDVINACLRSLMLPLHRLDRILDADFAMEIVEGDVYFLNGTQFTIGGTVSGSAHRCCRRGGL